MVFGIEDWQFGTHTEDGAVATRNGSFIQQMEGVDQLAAGIDGTLNFYGMEHAVTFDNHVNFIGVAIAVVPQQALPGVAVAGLQKLWYHKAFRDSSVDSTVC